MHRYTGEAGLGEIHNSELRSDMRELDLATGTAVKHVGRDDDRDLELIEWVDAQGNPRISSIEPELFASHFEEA